MQPRHAEGHRACEIETGGIAEQSPGVGINRGQQAYSEMTSFKEIRMAQKNA